MFLTLLLATFIVSAAVSYIVVRAFDAPVNKILSRIIKDDISSAWGKYLKFAVFVTGISGGIRIWNLEQFILPGRDKNLQLNSERWILEVYQTVIGTLQSIVWVLLLFFLIALIAYVIVRGQELKRNN